MKKKQTEKLVNSCGDLSLDFGRKDSISGDDNLIERIPEKVYDPSCEHPTPEQMLVRQAVRYLTPKQKVVWELYSYDRLTQDEIAKKLKVSRTTVEDHLQAIERKITNGLKAI